jgi:hypothetical protein
MKQAPSLKRVSFATPISQFMGEKSPTIADDGHLILPCTPPLFNESIYICDPMLFESRLSTFVEAAQHPTPSLAANSRLMEMSMIPFDKDWALEIEAPTKILQGGTTTLVDGVEVMLPPCFAVEPVHILKEVADVAVGMASTLDASLGSVPPEMGRQIVVVDLSHTDLHGNGVEAVNDQNTSSSRLQEPVFPQVPANIVENEVDPTSPQDPTAIAKVVTIDGFIASITKPVAAPLIPQLPEAIPEEEPNDQEIGNTPELPQTPPPPRPFVFTPQRKSSRLAKKSETTKGKGAIQVAEELLVKKLGDLSPPTTQEGDDQLEFYAQHFERPLTKEKMEALTVLIELGQQKSKKKRGRLTKVE